MDGITGEMTIKDALHFCSPAQQMNLRHWAASFGLRLCEFHIGHIKTYENERQHEVSLQVVNSEVSTLLSLLDSAGVGREIKERYRPLQEPDELAPEEKAGLPDRARKYIEKLESELHKVTTESDRTADRLRKANWARRRT
jgi:hypothetical protein